MTIEELNARIAAAMQTLQLAAQGAFSAAQSGPAVPAARRLAVWRFHQAMWAVNTHIEDAMQEFALALGSGPSSFDLAQAYKHQAVAEIGNVLSQMTQQLARAIRLGAGNPAALLLKRAHGAQGELVGQAVATVSLTARDMAGREWKDPAKLVQTYARQFAVRATVITQVEDMRLAGYTHAYLGEEALPLDAVQAELNTLFHPNSKEFLRADLHA